ncbi:hypothetical protein BHE74_00018522 [Ensete ventricosum]|nr:hypothetical protein GW17_00031153 [Ensete ventricosum]RWW73602.1 hypothetical protein BHE74_00018522 [Ensete ventricosum]
MLSLAETFRAIVVSCSSYSAIPTGVLSQRVGGHRPYLRSQVLGSFRNSALNSGKGLRGPIEASMWLWNSCKTLSLHVDLQNWSCLITIFQKLHGHDSGLDVDSSKEKALFDSIYMQLSSGWVGCAADTSSFKQVVQMLTGSAVTTGKHVASAAAPAKNPLSPPPVAKAATAPKKPAFKLYERRGSLKNLKMIGPLIPTLLGSNPSSPVSNGKPFSPSRNQMPEILSPGVLDFPSLALSPVTPLIPDLFNRPPHPNPAAGMSAEDRAIAEKGFYLHPSPRTTPRDAQPPRLLPLFPVTSPKMSSASAAAGSST